MDILTGITDSLAELGLTTGTLLVAASVLTVLYNWPVWDRHLYPPGPLPLPFLGHTLWLATRQNTYKSIDGLRKKYGDLVTLDLLRGKKLVVLNSAESHWEGFIKNADLVAERHSSGRNIFAPLGLSSSILSLTKGAWKAPRKHMASVFREHGIGGRRIEPKIQEEASYLHEALDKTKCEPFDIRSLLRQATCNVISTVAMASRFDYSDENLEKMQLADFVGLHIKARFAPFLKYLPSYKRALEKAKSGAKFVTDQVRKHKEDIDYDSPPRDYTDSYLIKIKEQEAVSNSMFNENRLKPEILSLYLAGTDTTSESLYWAVVYMVIFPEVQEKVYEEIKKTIGETNPSYVERHLLPYTMAVGTELFRVAPVNVMSLFYECQQDLTIVGQRIPAGTLIAGNKLPILKNEEFYPEPEAFRPERFMNDKGEFIVPEKKMLPLFGLGHRNCIGEHLARSEHFIFLASIIQKYRLELGQSETPSLVAQSGLTESCPSFLIRAIPRLK